MCACASGDSLLLSVRVSWLSAPDVPCATRPPLSPRIARRPVAIGLLLFSSVGGDRGCARPRQAAYLLMLSPTSLLLVPFVVLGAQECAPPRLSKSLLRIPQSLLAPDLLTGEPRLLLVAHRLLVVVPRLLLWAPLLLLLAPLLLLLAPLLLLLAPCLPQVAPHLLPGAPHLRPWAPHLLPGAPHLRHVATWLRTRLLPTLPRRRELKNSAQTARRRRVLSLRATMDFGPRPVNSFHMTPQMVSQAGHWVQLWHQGTMQTRQPYKNTDRIAQLLPCPNPQRFLNADFSRIQNRKEHCAHHLFHNPVPRVL